MNNPVAFRFVNGAMIPINPFFVARAAKQYEPGQVYVLVPQEARSPESHRFFFAALHEGWLNLTEEYAEQFPTAESLRAYALVKSGRADRYTIICATHDDALRTAAIAGSREKLRIINVDDCIVTIFIPHSMSMREMGKAEFEAAKRDCLDIIASMTHSTRNDLEANAGKAC